MISEFHVSGSICVAQKLIFNSSSVFLETEEGDNNTQSLSLQAASIEIFF